MSRVKDSLADMIGKIISGVVVAKNDEGNPDNRLFLVFSDGTSFEFWTESDELSVASSVNPFGMDDIVKILKRRPNTDIKQILDERHCIIPALQSNIGQS